MLLTVRHEWRLKSTEKYALDRLLGVSWEFYLFVSSSLFKRSVAPHLVQVWEKNWRKLPSDLWADFPRVALPTRARCGLQKNRFFFRALLGVCCLSQSRHQARFHWGSCHFLAHERWVVHRVCAGCPVEKLGCCKTLQFRCWLHCYAASQCKVIPPPVSHAICQPVAGNRSCREEFGEILAEISAFLDELLGDFSPTEPLARPSSISSIITPVDQ
jgi:hypothetical protein